MPEGYNLTELAKKLGRTPSWISERLSDLRSELLLQSGLFFPLADHEYEALKASIDRNGVCSPIIIGEHIALVDGRHRLLIAEELGLDDVPAIFLDSLSPEQEREIAISLNTARRQLTRAQKRTIVEQELMRDPGRSDRLIASIAGVSHPYVATIRTEIAGHQRTQAAATKPLDVETTPTSPTTTAPAEQERVPVDPPTRTDTLGRQQPVRERPIPPAEDLQDRPIGHADCAHGQRHAIIRDGAGYRLEGK